MNWQIKKTKTDEIIKNSNKENLKTFNFEEFFYEYFSKEPKKIIWADSTNEVQKFQAGDIIVIFEDDLEIELSIEINETLFNRNFVIDYDNYNFDGFSIMINTDSVEETKKLNEKINLLTKFSSEILDSERAEPEDIGNLQILISIEDIENIIIEYLENKIKI